MTNTHKELRDWKKEIDDIMESIYIKEERDASDTSPYRPYPKGWRSINPLSEYSQGFNKGLETFKSQLLKNDLFIAQQKAFDAKVEEFIKEAEGMKKINRSYNKAIVAVNENNGYNQAIADLQDLARRMLV